MKEESIDEYDYTGTKELVCPYCKHEQEDLQEVRDADEGELDYVCDSCDKEFYYSTEALREFSSIPALEYLEGRIKRLNYTIPDLAKEASKESDEGRKKWLNAWRSTEEAKLKGFEIELEELKND